MAGCTQTHPSSLLDLCLRKDAIYFINCLGLHPVTGTTPDHLVFESTVVNELCRQTAKKARSIAEKYSLKELKQLLFDTQFRDGVTKPLLESYGGQIWGSEGDHLIQGTKRSLQNSEDKKYIELNVYCWIMNLALRPKKKTTLTERRNVYELSPSVEPSYVPAGLPETPPTLTLEDASTTSSQIGFFAPVAKMYVQTMQVQNSLEDLLNCPLSSPEQATSQTFPPAHTIENENENVLSDTQECQDDVAQDPSYQPEMTKGRKRPRKNTGAGKKLPKISKPSPRKVKGRAVNVVPRNNFIGSLSHKDWDDALHVPNFPTLSPNSCIASVPKQKECTPYDLVNVPHTRSPVLENHTSTEITVITHRHATAAEEVAERDLVTSYETQTMPMVESSIPEAGVMLSTEVPPSADIFEPSDANHIIVPKETAEQLESIRNELRALLLEQLDPDSEKVSDVDYARIHQLLNKLWDADKVETGRELGDTFQRWMDIHTKVLDFKRTSQYTGPLSDWPLHRQQLSNPKEAFRALKAESALEDWMKNSSRELEPHTGDLARMLCKLSKVRPWFNPEYLTGFIVDHNKRLVDFLA